MPGIVPIVLASGAAIAAFGVARSWGKWSASAVERSARALAMARRAAALLLVDLADLAPLLGLPRTEVGRWVANGVPARHQRDVTELFRAAIALRRRFPAQVCRDLLSLRVQRRAAAADGRREIADWSVASRPGHITVRLR